MSKINPTLATKIVDDMIDFHFQNKSGKTPNLSRAEIKEIIQSMSQSRSSGKITLNFDENGSITPEVTLRGEAVLKHFQRNK